MTVTIRFIYVILCITWWIERTNGCNNEVTISQTHSPDTRNVVQHAQGLRRKFAIVVYPLGCTVVMLSLHVTFRSHVNLTLLLQTGQGVHFTKRQTGPMTALHVIHDAHVHHVQILVRLTRGVLFSCGCLFRVAGWLRSIWPVRSNAKPVISDNSMPNLFANRVDSVDNDDVSGIDYFLDVETACVRYVDGRERLLRFKDACITGWSRIPILHQTRGVCSVHVYVKPDDFRDGQVTVACTG